MKTFFWKEKFKKVKNILFFINLKLIYMCKVLNFLRKIYLYKWRDQDAF